MKPLEVWSIITGIASISSFILAIFSMIIPTVGTLQIGPVNLTSIFLVIFTVSLIATVILVVAVISGA